MEKLEQSGDILHTEPSAEQLEEGDFDSDFRLVYLTQNELAEVQKNIASNSEIEEFRVEPFQSKSVSRNK